MANREKFLLLSLTAVVLLPAFFFSAAFAGAAIVDAEKNEDFDFKSIKKVAFLPFTRINPDGGGSSSCPVYSGRHPACRIEDHAESGLSRIAAHALYGSSIDMQWIEQPRISGARARLKKEGHPEYTRYGQWQRAIGKEVDADAVLFGYIYCYRQRKGSALASAEPAAISFCLHLMDPHSGKIIWSFRYADEQQALFENLLNLPRFLKRGGKWITVEEMAQEAAPLIVEKFPCPGKDIGKQDQPGN